MTFKEILEYNILNLTKYSITVLDIIIIIALILGASLFLKLLKKVINSSANKLEIDKGRRHSIFLISKYFVWVITAALILETFDISVTVLIASSAALLVGLGLGLQNTFNDIVSGVILLFEGTIEVSDIIEIEDMVCQVVEINLRTTLVKDRDDKVIIIPNRKFVNDNVINWSHHKYLTRFQVKVGVHYDSDEILVKKALEEALNDVPNIITSEPYIPFARFDGFGSSSLDFTMLFWSKELFRILKIESNLRFKVREKFREYGIIIAYPQLDIHIDSNIVNTPIKTSENK